MDRLAKAAATFAVATLVATALLWMTTPRRSEAGSPSQDAVKAGAKVEVKVEIPRPPAENGDVARQQARRDANRAAIIAAAEQADRAAVAQAQAARATMIAEVQAQAVRAAVAQAQVAMSPEQAARQMLQPLRPILARELRMLTAAAGLSPPQRHEVAIEAGRTLREHVRLLARATQGNQPGRITAVTDPRKLVHTHLEIVAKANLPAEQFDRYRKELELKVQARREVVVLNVVANLDKRLSLGVDQREKLCESLRKHWDDRDYPTIEASVAYDAYVPVIPAKAIEPILSDEQRVVWLGLRKVNFSAIRNMNVANNNNLPANELDEGGDEDPDVKAALAEGPNS